MRWLVFILCLEILLFVGCTHSKVTASDVTEDCKVNESIQNARSAELLQIVKEDQADRSGPVEAIDWKVINPRDIGRRIRVAAIFAQGCFKKASDYASAALVFQHGNSPDHFYQTFIWANEAVKLGDESQRWLMAAGIDRYLVRIGHKQLFGTQFTRPAGGKWCLQPVEPSFPKSLRLEYVKTTLKEEISHVLTAIEPNQSPQETKVCEPALKASPEGTVPGFW